MDPLYDLPAVYDVAFGWDISQEVEFFRSLFARHVPFEVKRILEPACGTGRFLTRFPRCGYRIVGYDTNRAMAAYARRRIADCGCQESAQTLVADMTTASFQRKFGAAFNSINSIGYLLSDDDIVSHLTNTADAIIRDGVYIIHLSCAHEAEVPGGDEWSMERDGTRVATRWSIEREDHGLKLSHQLCRMQVDDRGIPQK